MSQPSAIRVDLQLIADMIQPDGRALDIGCGDGALLAYLVNFKQVDARGMELSQTGVNACVANGLSVIQGNADTDLFDYPDSADMDLTVGSCDDPSRFVPVHHFAIETALTDWLDTKHLPGKRLDENPATVDRWMAATGKLPE